MISTRRKTGSRGNVSMVRGAIARCLPLFRTQEWVKDPGSSNMRESTQRLNERAPEKGHTNCRVLTPLKLPGKKDNLSFLRTKEFSKK